MQPSGPGLRALAGTARYVALSRDSGESLEAGRVDGDRWTIMHARGRSFLRVGTVQPDTETTATLLAQFFRGDDSWEQAMVWKDPAAHLTRAMWALGILLLLLLLLLAAIKLR